MKIGAPCFRRRGAVRASRGRTTLSVDMFRLFGQQILLFVTVGTLAAAVPAHAETATDADAARIAAAGHSLKWNWTPPGRGGRFGHAETLIHAPVTTVRGFVQDYGHYTKLAPSIITSRVVGHQADGAVDVYIRMGVINNMLVLWNVMRFAVPRPDAGAGGEVIEGRMVPGKGNIDDSAAVWTVRAAGPEWTVLKFDLLLKPSIPAPASLIDEQLRDSANDAVDSIHDLAQGSKGILPYGG
jgi:hypothetical protein